MDARQRELYLLFRSYAGYENALLRMSTKPNRTTASPVGFVTFATKEQAEEALKELQGVCFDPETKRTVRLELARSNTKVTKPKQISPPTIIPPPLPTPIGVAGTASFPSALLQAAAAAAATGTPQPFLGPPPPPAAAAALPTSSPSHPHHPIFVAPLQSPHHHHHHHHQQQQQQQQQDLLNAAAAAQVSASCLNDPNVAQFLNEHQFLLNSLPQFAAAAPQPQLLMSPNAAAAVAAGLPIPVNSAAVAVSTSSPIVGGGVPTVPGAAFLQPNAATIAQLQHAQLAAAAQLNAVTHANVAAAAANAAVAAHSAQPCSTLFVANLGLAVTEEELKAVFGACPGFSRLRLHTKSGSTVAFVEFGDIRQATVAMNTLQGTHIPSSDRGGMRIEYARNKMGDVNGHWLVFSHI